LDAHQFLGAGLIIFHMASYKRSLSTNNWSQVAYFRYLNQDSTQKYNVYDTYFISENKMRTIA